MANPNVLFGVNKYNVPEVLSLLVRALETAQLGDTVEHLRQMGVMKIINEAWQHRSKTATLEQKWGSFLLRQKSADEALHDLVRGNGLYVHHKQVVGRQVLAVDVTTQSGREVTMHWDTDRWVTKIGSNVVPVTDGDLQ